MYLDKPDKYKELPSIGGSPWSNKLYMINAMRVVDG